jgi:serine/threonine protein phosphatase PrpC
LLVISGVLADSGSQASTAGNYDQAHDPAAGMQTCGQPEHGQGNQTRTRRIARVDARSNQSNAPLEHVPLPPGATVGEYRILHLISSEPTGNTYLAQALTADQPAYHLWEYPAGTEGPLLALAHRNVAHPALLTPKHVLSGERASYVSIPAPADPQPPPALPPAEALRQIIALGEGLALLHRQGVAHLRVHPDNLVWRQERLVLGGLEAAQMLPPGSPDAPFFFARDANFLALTLGALTGAGAGHPADQQLEAAINTIREKGSDQAYRSVEQVLAECRRAVAQFAESAAPDPAAQPAGPVWAIASGHATSVGLVRTNNEDALGRLELTLLDGHGQPIALACFLVADGVGGETRGELASHLAVHIILEGIVRQMALPALAPASVPGAQPEWQQPRFSDRERLPREALLDGFRVANRAIYGLARAQGQVMATTATALLLVGNQATIAHVGDSRAYRFRNGTLTALTEDHSIIQRLLRLGQLTPAEAASHPKRNTLYRSLGQQEQIEVEVRTCSVEEGDRLLLCTDGLWGAVPHERLEQVLAEQRSSPALAVAAQLVALADAAGGEDNSTAIILDICHEQAFTASDEH